MKGHEVCNLKITAALVIMMMSASVAFAGVGFSIPLATVDETLPVVGGASLKMGASLATPGSARMASEMSDQELLEHYDVGPDNRTLWRYLNGGRKIVGNFDSLRAGEIGVVPNRCMEYPFQITWNTPFKARRLGYAMANRTKEIETVKPLVFMENGWFGLLPIQELIPGMPYQILLYAELEGRKDWTFFGFIHHKSKTGKEFSSAVTINVKQPAENLETLPPQDAALYFAEILGWQPTYLPDAKAYVAMRKSQAQAQAGVVTSPSVPARETSRVEPEEKAPEPGPEPQRQSNDRSPDLSLPGWDGQDAIQLLALANGKNLGALAAQELTETGEIQNLETATGELFARKGIRPQRVIYQLQLGSGTHVWETATPTQFEFRGEPVKIPVRRKKLGEEK